MTSVPATEPPHDDEPGRPPARVGRGRRWIAFFAFAFFFSPPIAYVLGERAKPIENRELAAAPSPAHGWQFFPETSAWLTDHLPLRRQAIDANSSISRRVFDEEPAYASSDGAVGGAGPAGVAEDDDRSDDAVSYPRVVTGRDGWLYIGEDFQHACERVRPVAENLAQIDRIARLVEASGRRFLFTVAPNKSTITPEFLPDTLLGRACWESASDRLWRALRQEPPDHYFDLRNRLERQEEADGEPIFLKYDTHWAPRAYGVYAESLADALDPRIWPGTTVEKADTAVRSGDLARILADDESSQVVQDWNVVRPGVTGDHSRPPRADGTPRRLHNASTDAELFAPRSLLLGDSFTQTARPEVLSLFADVTLLHIQDASDDVVAASIAEAEVIVLEIVERSTTGGHSLMFRDERLDAIERALA